jgi:hypothetical protein
VGFTTIKVARGAYRVSAPALKPGEYCFYYGTTLDRHNLFNFGVDKSFERPGTSSAAEEP